MLEREVLESKGIQVYDCEIIAQGKRIGSYHMKQYRGELARLICIALMSWLLKSPPVFL